MFTTRVDIPNWITIQTSEMGPTFIIGKVLAVWYNNVKVQWWGADNLPHIGIYTISKHVIAEPSDADWHKYYDWHQS